MIYLWADVIRNEILIYELNPLNFSELIKSISHEHLHLVLYKIFGKNLEGADITLKLDNIENDKKWLI